MKSGRTPRRTLDPHWALGALILLTALVFSRLLGAPYVQWDDNVMILENVLLRMPFVEALRAFLTGFYHGDYIPVTLLSFWVDVKLFGFSAPAQHAGNLLLHLLNIFLVWKVLERWRLPAAAAFAVCVVFALHPVQVESVAWVSERKGLLSLALLLAAILCSERAETATGKRAAWVALYGLLYALSFLAKATGVLLPVLLIVADRFLRNLSWKKSLLKHAPVLTVAAVASWARVSAYQSSIPGLMTATLSTERLVSLPGQALAALGFYARIFFFPFHLSIIYPPYYGGDWGLETLLGFGCLVLFAWLVVRGWKRGWSVVLGLFAACCLLPVLQIVPRINFVNDRYLYIPIVGLTGLIAVNRRRFEREDRLLRTFVPLGLLALVLGALSFVRSGVWTSDSLLWRDTVERNPRSGLARNNHAQALQREGDLAGAVAEFEATLDYGRADGTDGLAYNNLALLHSDPKNPKMLDLPKAARLLEEGIARESRLEETFTLRYNLAGVYAQMGDSARAQATITQLEAMIQSSNNRRYDFLLERIRAERGGK